jgi:putative endonuclease
MKNGNPLVLARKGEEFAAALLFRKNYEILQMNFHSRFGEIDIVAKHHNYIVFVEVKTRSDLNRDIALETVTLKKQKRIIKTALHFLHLYQDYAEFMVRYDIILVFHHRTVDNYSFEHIEDAFSPCGI